MGQCIPEAREPPTEKIRQCRMMLQALCGSLGVMGLLAILSGDFLSVINYLLYAYLLLMGWRTFNWCIMLMGFLLMSTQIVTVIIIFIGMLQYHLLFQRKNQMYSVFIIMQLFFYPTAIWICHYAYRYFKDLDPSMMGVGMGGGPANAPLGNAQPEGQYQRMPEERPAPPQPRAGENNRYFQGQGYSLS